MEDVHGKEIDLQKTTIKMPGANKPRIGKTVTVSDANKLANDINIIDLNGQYSKDFIFPISNVYDYCFLLKVTNTVTFSTKELSSPIHLSCLQVWY
jgi:hypothetical protein